MRLLTLDSHGELCVTRDLADDLVPPYAILSHTWGADEEEVAFHEIQSASSRNKTGYQKIEFCRQQAYRDGFQHVWVDTCCIDKANHVELSKAITCMYRWYQNAQVCYVYLADVSVNQNENGVLADANPAVRVWETSFRTSRWFTRGWTLQELLAPKELVFYSSEGRCLGTKNELKDLIHEITSIPTLALINQPLSQFSITERMRWSQDRKTKEKEDQAYCLLGIFNVFMPLIYGEGDNALVRLTKAINDVPKVVIPLKVVDGATFDAYGQTHQGCHPATRIDLLESIRNWTRDVNGKSIFWVNGAAGTGKSTISWTVARWLSDLDASGTVSLGASFFFRRGEGDRASAALLFSTIAMQLASSVTSFDTFLAQAVQTDPQIAGKSLGEQFNKLILKPLQQVRSGTKCITYVIVLDALDECDDEDNIRTILRLWSVLPTTNLIRFRLFLTSRPELVIRLGFRKMSTNIYHDLILHEIPCPIIRRDIQTFLTDALGEVRREHNLILDDDLVDEQLGDDWPGEQVLQKLTQLSMPLFIVAATIYRLIRDADRPHQRLETILQSRQSVHLTEMGKVYLIVLQAMAASLKDEQEILQVHHQFRTIVGAIITLAEPLSRTALAALLDIAPGDIQIRLRSLHAVLQVPSDGKTPIRPHHLSFSEYLTSQEVRGTPYCVDAIDTHRFLWRRCLQLLSSPTGLHENICHLSYPGQGLSEVPSARINESLLPELQYACRYWVHHVQASSYRICDGDDIHIFLRRHLLHWLEALSCMSRLADAIEFVTSLSSMISVCRSNQVKVFLEDARRFVLTFRYVGEQAPLQLYSSAIAFAPRTSAVRRICGRLPLWIKQGPVTSPTWNLERQKLEGHKDMVFAVAFSPSGLLMASGSRDKTVRLWDVKTGREIQTLEGHTNDVLTLRFSPDGSLLASGSRVDKTIRLWDANTGREVQTLKDYNGEVNALAFSPSGSLFTFGSRDKTVRLWDVRTGREAQTLRGHTGAIQAMIFSCDDLLLVSAAAEECTVRVWDMKTFQEIQALQYPGSMNTTAAILPNNLFLASRSDKGLSVQWGADKGRKVHWPDRCWFCKRETRSDDQLFTSVLNDGTVWLWDANTSRGARRLNCCYSCKIAIWPKDQLLASASSGAPVRLWHTKTGQMVQTLPGYTSNVDALAFSPSEPLLASGSSDRTIRLWDLKMGQEVPKLGDHPHQIHYVRNVIFSYDGSLLASVRDNDGTVQLWDVRTGRKTRRLGGCANGANTVVFSPTSSVLAAKSDGTVKLWDAKTGREVQNLVGDYSEPIMFSPSGALLAIRSDYWTVRLWDVRTGHEVQKLGGYPAHITVVAFSHDDAFIALVLDDRTVRLWDLNTSQEVQKLGHIGDISAVAFSPVSSHFASGSSNITEWGRVNANNGSTVRLWDMSSGQEVHLLGSHFYRINAVSFSHDGLLLASVSYDELRLWDTRTGQLLQEMKDVGHIRYLNFLSDNSTLWTSRGYIQTKMMRQSPDAVVDHGLRLRGQWIEIRGQKLLWLPQEYRGWIEAVFENTMAVGHTDGSVTILRIEYPHPSSMSLASDDTPASDTTDMTTARPDQDINQEREMDATISQGYVAEEKETG